MDKLSRLSGSTPPPSPNILSSLPVELLHQIFDLLTEGCDVASTRLTCSRLAFVGGEHLRSDIRLVYAQKSFQEAETIAKHPSISRSIRSLRYETDRVGSHPHIDEWVKHGRVPPKLRRQEYALHYMFSSEHRHNPNIAPTYDPNLHSGLHSSLDLIEDGWFQQRLIADGPDVTPIAHHKPAMRYAHETSQRLWREQRDIDNTATDLRILTSVLRLCDRLDQITLSGCTSWPEDELPAFARRDAGVIPRGDPDLLDAGVEQFKKLCSAVVSTGASIRRMTLVKMGCRLVTLAFDDALVCQEALRLLHDFRLSVSIDDEKTHIRHFGGSFFEPNIRGSFFDGVWCYDRRLIARKAAALWSGLDPSAQAKFIPDLLSSMSHLRVLRLVFPREHIILENRLHSESPRVNLGDMFRSTTWPKLRDLAVSNVVTTQTDLLDLLLRHRRTLRKLSLHCLTFTQGSWTSIWPHLVGGAFPRLRKLSLDGGFWTLGGGDFGVSHYWVVSDERRKYAKLTQEELDGGMEIQGWDVNDLKKCLDNPYAIDGEVHDWPAYTADVNDDGGYDSDGLHISYGSDDFD